MWGFIGPFRSNNNVAMTHAVCDIYAEAR